MSNLVVFFLLVLLAGGNAAGLRGVGLYESDHFTGIGMSMAGGGYINIAADGSSFDGAPQSNQLFFKNTDLGGGDIRLQLPQMSGK